MPPAPAAATWLVPALSGFFLTMLHHHKRARTDWCRPRAERLAASDDDEADLQIPEEQLLVCR